MRFIALLVPFYVIGVVAPGSVLTAQIFRTEAESGVLNGFSVVQNDLFSGGARINGDVTNPTAAYIFAGWDGVYDISVRYCDEDDGVSSYQLSGSSAGAIASWDGDQQTDSTVCGSAALIVREVATSVTLEEGETVTFTCQRVSGEPCRVDYFAFAYVPPVGPVSNCIGAPADHPEVDYPERRVYLESQGWWGERVNGDVPRFGNAEHLHIGACFPLQQMVSGVVRMDFRVVAHNAPAGSIIDRTHFHDGGEDGLYVPPIYWNRVVGANETDVVEWAANVQVDTRLFQDGLREARPLTFLERPNGAEIHASGGWCWNIQNIPGTADDADPQQFCTNKVVQGRGWYDCFEYKNAEVWGWDYPYEGIPSGQSYTINISGKDGAGGTGGVTDHFARLNPNFHMDDQGVVLFDHAGGHFNEPLTIGGDILTPGVHVLFLMAGENGACSPQDGEISGGIRVPILVNRERVPVDLEVDVSAMGSDGNMVLEPGEQVEVAPSWRNDGMFAQILDGVASDFTGPSGATYTLLTEDASYGTLQPGETASCLETGVCYEMGLNAPPVRPTAHWDAAFEETLSDADATTQTWILHVGDSFTDVARTNPFYRFIETALHHGVTSGCGGGQYCPTGGVPRGGMAVFLLKSKVGPGYLPPACVAGDELFGDVPAGNAQCRWIEELARRGVVGGCGGGNYCPSSSVTRAQMAVFLLKTLEGGNYTPPPCSGLFTDVPCPSTFANWIEDLTDRGVTGGCTATKYCPTASVTRDQMAVFLSRTFSLTLYGP